MDEEPIFKVRDNGTSVFTWATIKKDKLDPELLKQIDNMEATIKKLTKMVNQLYYPYGNFND